MKKDIFLNWDSWFYRAIILLLILLLILNKFPMPLSRQIKTAGHYRQIMKWPKANASVISSSWESMIRNKSTGEKQFCSILEYAYIVDGRIYKGQNEVFEFSCNPASFKYVVIRTGSSIGIAYDPANPAISIIPDTLLNPGFPWGGLIYTIILALILAIFLIKNIRYYFRLKQNQIQEESIISRIG
jgi:hypothetical protein